MLNTPLASNPGSNFASAVKLRPNSAAPTSSVTVTAICPATIVCSVRPVAPPRASIAPSRRSCASECLPIERSGDRPITTVINTPSPATNASVRQSTPGVAKLGSCTGLSASRASPAHIASRQPAVPPSATTHALSDNIKRINRRSSAPIARRSENSRRRDSVRASSRLATLAHAITSTNATAPNSSEIAGRIWPNTSLESCATSTPRLSLVAGYACASCRATLVTSACACASDTPGARRARAGKPRLPREARACGGIEAIIETHTSLASDRPVKRAGAIPTMVKTWLLS